MVTVTDTHGNVYYIPKANVTQQGGLTLLVGITSELPTEPGAPVPFEKMAEFTLANIVGAIVDRSDMVVPEKPAGPVAVADLDPRDA